MVGWSGVGWGGGLGKFLGSALIKLNNSYHTEFVSWCGYNFCSSFPDPKWHDPSWLVLTFLHLSIFIYFAWPDLTWPDLTLPDLSMSIVNTPTGHNNVLFTRHPPDIFLKSFKHIQHPHRYLLDTRFKTQNGKQPESTLKNRSKSQRRYSPTELLFTQYSFKQ